MSTTEQNRPQVENKQPKQYASDKSELTYAEATKYDSKLESLLTQQAEKLDKLLDQMLTMMNLLTTIISKLVR